MMKTMFLIVLTTIFTGFVFGFDICFNMESSQDISESQWRNSKFIAKQIIDGLSAFESSLNVRVSAVKYDGLATTVSGLKSDLNQVKQLIEAQQRGHRLDGFPLNGVRQCLDLLRDGYYDDGSNNLQLLVTISDGKEGTGPVTACNSDFTDADGVFSHARLCGPCDGNYFVDYYSMYQRIHYYNIQTVNIYYDLNENVDTSSMDCLVNIYESQTSSQSLVTFSSVENLESTRNIGVINAANAAVEKITSYDAVRRRTAHETGDDDDDDDNTPSSVRRLISVVENVAVNNIDINNHDTSIDNFMRDEKLKPQINK